MITFVVATVIHTFGTFPINEQNYLFGNVIYLANIYNGIAKVDIIEVNQ